MKKEIVVITNPDPMTIIRKVPAVQVTTNLSLDQIQKFHRSPNIPNGYS